MERILDEGTRLQNKVPEVTAYFWIIKLLAVTVGETAADFLAAGLRLGLNGTSAVMGALLAVALALHMRSRRYVPWLYWVTVVLLSIVGTLITDNLSDNLGVPLRTTTVIFSLALLAAFASWYAVEKTLSIRTIYTARREAFSWAAILLTFARGTAGGLGLGPTITSAVFLCAIVALVSYLTLTRRDALGSPRAG